MLPKFALIRSTSSSTLRTPLRSISSRRMICTGNAVSPSTRGTCEPVTVTRSSVVAGSAAAGAGASVAVCASASACGGAGHDQGGDV